MKKKLLALGLSLFLTGLCLYGAGWMMGGSTEATVHLFGRDMLVSCMPVSFYGWGGRNTAASNPVPSTEWAYAEQDTGVYAEGEDHSYRSYYDMAAFRQVEIDVAVGNVTICPSDSYGVYLEWSGAGYALNYSLDGDTLKVWSEGEVSGVNIFSDTIGQVTEGPATESAETEGGTFIFSKDVPTAVRGLAGVSGDVIIYIPEGKALHEVDCHVALGDIYAYNVIMESAELSIDLGDLNLSECAVDSALNVESSMGNVDIYDCELYGETDISASMGNIYIDGLVRGDVDIDADMGNVNLYLDDPISEYRWALDVGMGRVSVYDDSGSYNQSSSNGGLSGGSGDSVLDVDAGMGNIDVMFSWS